MPRRPSKENALREERVHTAQTSQRLSIAGRLVARLKEGEDDGYRAGYGLELPPGRSLQEMIAVYTPDAPSERACTQTDEETGNPSESVAWEQIGHAAYDGEPQADGLEDARTATTENSVSIARDLNGAYPPVQEMSCLLAEKRREYDDQVSNRLDEVCAANERKEFEKALELAETLRASMKLSEHAAEQLKQQEHRARTCVGKKEKKRQVLKDAQARLHAYDYLGALKRFEEGFEEASNLWNGDEPDYTDALKSREETLRKQKRLEEFLLTLRSAAEEEPVPPVEVLEQALKTVDEAATLHPDDPTITAYVQGITRRLNRTKEDRARPTNTLKSSNAGQSGENNRVITGPSLQGRAELRSKGCEEQRHTSLTASAKNGVGGPDYRPESKQRSNVLEFPATPADHNSHVDPVQLSKRLRAEGDQLIREARSEQSFEVSQDKYRRGLENYRQSRQLYSPPDVRILNETIHEVESEMQHRLVRKCLSDAEELERHGLIVDALSLYQRAYASQQASLPRENRMQLQGKIQALTNRMNDARTLRTKGENQETRGRLADAITSYKQSLELVLDKTLEQHVAVLEDELAKAKDEGTTSSGPTKEAYLQELRAKQARAQALHEEAVKFREETFARRTRR